MSWHSLSVAVVSCPDSFLPEFDRSIGRSAVIHGEAATEQQQRTSTVSSFCTMAITAVPSCLGPPPLPPGKRFLQKTSKKMSSTYHSFRDPAVEAWIPNEIQKPDQQSKAHSRDQTRTPRVTNNLYRSCSEGHLNSKKTAMLTSTPLDKCIKAIYGSWRNLMQRKSLLELDSFYVLMYVPAPTPVINLSGLN